MNNDEVIFGIKGHGEQYIIHKFICKTKRLKISYCNYSNNSSNLNKLSLILFLWFVCLFFISRILKKKTSSDSEFPPIPQTSVPIPKLPFIPQNSPRKNRQVLIPNSPSYPKMLLRKIEFGNFLVIFAFHNSYKHFYILKFFEKSKNAEKRPKRV